MVVGLMAVRCWLQGCGQRDDGCRGKSVVGVTGCNVCKGDSCEDVRVLAAM